MRPKGKLLGLVVMFAAVGLITASGAFTTVEADRTADVTTAGDSSALVGIAPASENGDYLKDDNTDGEYEFDIANPSGQQVSDAGVNMNATTYINGTINITNNGANNVDVYLEASGQNSQYVSFYDNSTGQNITGAAAGDAAGVTPGTNVTVSVIVDTPPGQTVGSDTELIDTITIVAEDAS
jgi:hypothetical protein